MDNQQLWTPSLWAPGYWILTCGHHTWVLAEGHQGNLVGSFSVICSMCITYHKYIRHWCLSRKLQNFQTLSIIDIPQPDGPIQRSYTPSNVQSQKSMDSDLTPVVPPGMSPPMIQLLCHVSEGKGDTLRLSPPMSMHRCPHRVLHRR